MTKDEIAAIEKDITMSTVGDRKQIEFKPNIVLFDHAMHVDEAMLRVHLANYLRRIAKHLET